MKLNFYAFLRLLHKRVLPIFAGLLLLSNGLLAQKFFTPAPASSIANARGTAMIKSKSAFQLNEPAMRSYLLAAPMEFKNNGVTIPLEIPFPDGTTETFRIVESPVLSPAVAAEHPEIKTYTGNGTIDKKLVIRISLTSEGFNAIIINLKGSESIYFEKASGNIYITYFSKDIIEPQGNNIIRRPCGTPPAMLRNPAVNTPVPTNGAPNSQNRIQSTGTTLRTFRLTMSGNGEFTQNHGGTVAAGFAAIVGYANRMKAVFRNELSCDFTLVSGSSLVYPNPATDPFTGSDDIIMLNENQHVVDSAIGNANYDAGFVMGYNGTGYSPGGVAYGSSLCDNTYKGGGVSQEGDFTIYAQLYADKTLFHEMGHKFGMDHSYNSSIPVCTTREPSTSVEPGSGATLMSYGFKCNDATGDDDYFESTTIGLLLHYHSVSYNQAVTFLSTLVGGASIATGNTPPVITMPSAYIIPKSTPFSLTGSATDINNDALTYSWEGTNLGTVAPPSPTDFGNTAIAPFFRSYEPVATGTRIYPLLDSILNGTNNSRGDKLPSVSVATTHSLTVRDNNAAGGGVSNASVTITVNGSVGPFLETTNLSGTYGGLSAQNITWSVNGTNVATPNVKISFSSDGGHTFPTTLLASTPNDGNEIVVLPNTLTSMGRIKVEAVGNIFFDISNINFTIGTILPITLLSFDATLINKKDALLQWKTTAEVKVKGYEIEMKQGSTAAFKSLGFVNAKGNSTTLTNYDFTAPNLTTGTYYFRLKIVDLDGSISYSAVRILTITNSNGMVRMYPTPVKNQLTVVLSAELLHAQLQVVNSIGQVMATNTAQSGNTRLINMDNMSKGMYLLKVWDGSKLVTTQKIVKD